MGEGDETIWISSVQQFALRKATDKYLTIHTGFWFFWFFARNAEMLSVCRYNYSALTTSWGIFTAGNVN